MIKNDIETQVRREFQRKTLAQIALAVHAIPYLLYVGFNIIFILNIWWDYGTLLWWTTPGGGTPVDWFFFSLIWTMLFAAHVFAYQYFYGRLKRRREQAVYEEVERRLHLQQARAKLKHDSPFYDEREEDDVYFIGDDGELLRGER